MTIRVCVCHGAQLPSWVYDLHYPSQQISRENREDWSNMFMFMCANRTASQNAEIGCRTHLLCSCLRLSHVFYRILPTPSPPQKNRACSTVLGERNHTRADSTHDFFAHDPSIRVQGFQVGHDVGKVHGLPAPKAPMKSKYKRGVLSYQCVSELINDEKIWTELWISGNHGARHGWSWFWLVGIKLP